MWKINCDIIFLLVFLLVTTNCSKLRDKGSNGLHDLAHFNSTVGNDVFPPGENLFGTDIKTKIADSSTYHKDDHLSPNVYITNSESDSDKISVLRGVRLESGYVSHQKPYFSSNQLSTATFPIRDSSMLSAVVDNHIQDDSLCPHNENCEKRVRRSIYNSPTGTSNAEEYPLPLISEGGKAKSRKTGRQLNVNSSIDDIITGIMKLLGGNVKITAAETTPSLKKPTVAVLKTRINNRGPPRLPDVPFGVPAIPHLTRPLIRPPIRATKKTSGIPFTLNTKPPYPVPFPPKLFEPPSKRPFLNGIPLPINILPNNDAESTSEHVTEKTDATDDTLESSVATTEMTEEALHTLSSLKSIATEPTLLESSIKQDGTEEFPDTNLKTATIDDALISKTTTTPLPNLTVKFSLATNEKVKLTQSSQGMVPVEATTKQASSTTVFTNNLMPGVRATGIVRPTDISPEDLYVYPSIPTRLPDPIRSYGHRGTVLPDSTFPLNQVITAGAGGNKNIFDVTVSAIQGYNSPTRPTLQRPVRPVNPLITSATKSNDGVFIDGRKTYFDLQPGRKPTQTIGIGTVIPEAVQEVPHFPDSRPGKVPVATIRPTLVKKPVTASPKPKPKPTYRPTLGPPKRIDTCIVGYDNTCKKELGEVCRTGGDVSSCFCRPGTARRRARSKCKKSVVLQLSLKVDKVGDRRISWNDNYATPKAREYQILSYEAEKALDSAFTLTAAMNGLYLGSTINKFYSLGGNVIVNSTVQLVRTPQTLSTNIRRSLQRHLIRVIQTNNNYIGKSVLAVEGYLNPIPDVSDVNECFDATLNDCNTHASCTNVFGSFRCTCYKGYTDRNENKADEAGRQCLSCSRDYCFKRGNCTIENERKVCSCDSSFYGARCEIDGEVISVAVGASVVAIVIILLTLVLLCWKSRQWKAEDRRAQIFSAAGGFFGWRGRSQPEGAYSMNMRTKGGNPAYGAMMEDRIRWSQMAESLAQQNIYAPCSTSDLSHPLGMAVGPGPPSNQYYTTDKFIPSNSSFPVSMYNKVTRALSNPYKISKAGGQGILGGFKKFMGRGSANRNPPGSAVPSNPGQTFTLQQLLALHQQLQSQNQPEQMRPAVYPEPRKMPPPPSEYGSAGPLAHQQFGMHCMNPPPFLPVNTGGPNSLSQFTSTSINAASMGGISRAPTLGARTPQPIRISRGMRTIGPLGGGVAIKYHRDGMSQDSSEEDDRPYHLPRPKSRGSLADTSDFYFEPDDLMTRFPPLPTSPPPAVPFYHPNPYLQTRLH